MWGEGGVGIDKNEFMNLNEGEKEKGNIIFFLKIRKCLSAKQIFGEKIKYKIC